MPKVTIQYCASLREAVGSSSETVETERSTLGELFEELRSKHKLVHTPSQVIMAVNSSFVPAHTILKEGDHILLMPPFSGG